MKIALTGSARSGKDSVCDYLMKSTGKEFVKLYFAEGIEDIIHRYFPEAFEGNSKPRKHYQDIGQFMRSINPKVWINHTERIYKTLLNVKYEDFLVTDLRQPNEYEWLKDNGFTVIKVEAEPEIRIKRMKEAGDKFNMQDLLHPVEMQIDNLPYNYLVTNNTTLEDLYEQVDFIVQELEGAVK